ncbi:hypothetical protein ACWEQL_21320 [Kitasatospora sp. NPDC004240]
MYREPRIDLDAHVGAVLTGLTGAQKDYLRGPSNQTPTDAQALDELEQLRGVLQRALIELDLDRPLNEESASQLAWHVRAVTGEIRQVTEGHGRLPGIQARRALFGWAQGEGSTAWAAVADLRRRLVALLQARDAADAAAQQSQPPRQRQAPAPLPPRGNHEILLDELSKVLGHPGPKGDAPAVKAILVLGGQAYRGQNDGTGLLQVTYDVVVNRVDRLESWTVDGCAEVRALDRFVHAQGLASEDLVVDAFRKSPVAFPDGWIAAMDARGRDGRVWVKRTPCANCQQWLRALGIQADTQGSHM